MTDRRPSRTAADLAGGLLGVVIEFAVVVVLLAAAALVALIAVVVF
jgi:hypothetical protein